MAIGDSITTTLYDEVDGLGWPGHLIAMLGANWRELPARYAIGGHDTSEMKADIDAALALRTRHPAYAFVLLGANDVVDAVWNSLTEEAWKTNYRYILDAIHTKFSGTLIYCLKSYRDNHETRMHTLNGWLDDLVAEHPAYLFDTYDSEPILDGHPELCPDGVHANHAGAVAMATALVEILDL